MIFFYWFFSRIIDKLFMKGGYIMEIMFYVTIIILSAIIIASAGYLIHYYINTRESPVRDKDKNL